MAVLHLSRAHRASLRGTGVNALLLEWLVLSVKQTLCSLRMPLLDQLPGPWGASGVCNYRTGAFSTATPGSGRQARST